MVSSTSVLLDQPFSHTEPESAFANILRGGTNNFKAGAGFTAAFGYAFKEGFSTEMEWGYQKIRTDNPIENLSQDISLGGFSGFGGLVTLSPSITIENNGELKTQSLMGNGLLPLSQMESESLCWF